MLAYHMIVVTRHLQGTEHIVQETLVQVEGDQLQKEMLKTDSALQFRIANLFYGSGSVNLNYGSGRIREGQMPANNFQIRIIPGHLCGYWKKY